MQALSRTKGRLSIDYRQQNVEHHHNPYLGMELIAERKYVPRAKEVEPLVAVPNFRKLKQSDKDCNYRLVGVGKGVDKVTNTIDLIQESKERIKEKKEREKRLKEEMSQSSSNSSDPAPVSASFSSDPRDSLYRNRFSHIPAELR